MRMGEMKLEGDASRIDAVWVRSIGGDDSEFFCELADLFEAQCEELHVALSAPQLAEREALRAIVHKTKGSAMAVGLHGLGDMLAALERVLHAPATTDTMLLSACAQLREGLQISLAALREYIENNQ